MPILIQSPTAIPSLEDLRAHVEAATPTALLLATAHLLDDASILLKEWKPDLSALPRGGHSEATGRVIREFCLERLASIMGLPMPQVPRPSGSVMAAAAAWVANIEEVDEVQLLLETLAIDGDDPAAPDWDAQELAPDRQLRVAIIGSGMSGLLQALRLKQAGIPFVIFEKNPGIGGTWFENDYPDCRTDVASAMYMYSFESYDWPTYFAEQHVILDFLRAFAAKNGLEEHIRYNVEVSSAKWDVARGVWVLHTKGSGLENREEFNALVSAVGQLNRPYIPRIAGADLFRGPQFHSAEWDHSVDFVGKNVVVVGTGASALQFGPAVARIADHVTIIQRTPPWLVSTPELRKEVPDSERWLLSHLPAYRAWYRFTMFAPRVHGQLDAATVDPGYPPTERAISAASDLLRKSLAAYLELQIGSDMSLRDFVMPDYPPGAKRYIRDDGTWVSTLKRDNVSLVKGGIAEIREDSVVAEDGTVIPCDVILYGTGFRGSDFLTPMDIVGQDGISLNDRWNGTPAAYLGVTVPGFPNLFLLYGPNTGVVVHGNTVFFMESQVKYVMSALRLLLVKKAQAISVKPETFDVYQQSVEEANALRAWQWSGVSSWYKNARGKSPIMWPFRTVAYWRRTRAVALEDYELVGAEGDAL